MNYQRFQHPVTEQVYQALDELKHAKQKLTQSLKGLPSLIGDNAELRKAVLAHLYWFEEDIQPGWLADIFDICNAQQVSRHAGEATVTDYCDECKKFFDYQVTSRSALKAGHSCPECQEKREIERNRGNAQWHKEYEARLAAQRARYVELRTMPYKEYLQTAEWQERRRQAMKRAGFRCQICNAYGVRLNVHHRTYERRGNEDNRDLITLCEDCHATFHENGRLAMVEA